MINDFKNPLKRLLGFDTQGQVFIYQDRILRGIFKGKGELYLNILKICTDNDLFRYGIVKSWICKENILSTESYDFVVEHEKVPFISYPHEWCAKMLKDAALFTIDLSLILIQYDLILKDSHPYNIVFNNTTPIFLDFTSIIPADRITDPENNIRPHRSLLSPFQYLWDIYATYIYEMYRSMFYPYFIVPLSLMQYYLNEEAKIQLQTPLNSSYFPIINKRRLLFTENKRTALSLLSFLVAYSRHKFNVLIQKWALTTEKGMCKQRFLRLLKKEVQSLCSAPRKSGYTGYYKEKGEEFSFEPSEIWNEKNMNVYNIIQKLKPNTLLDIGSNTGWFSVLASKLGCQVVAFDADESCVSILYEKAKAEQLRILPLVMDITSPTTNIFLNQTTDDEKDKTPFIQAAKDRFKCEMVLALALIHHLVFNRGLNLDEIICLLDSFSTKYLVLEFVSKNDKLILQDPISYPAFHSNPHKFDWYTLNNLIIELKKYYRTVYTMPSFPDTRMLLVCEK